MENLINCYKCQENYTSSDIIPDLDKPICKVCYEDIMQDSFLLKVYHNGAVLNSRWNYLLGFRSVQDSSIVDNKIFGINHIKSFGDKFMLDLIDGYSMIEGGWIIGKREQYKYKHSLNDLINALNKRRLIPPMPIIMCMKQRDTFVMDIVIIVKEQDKSLFYEWLLRETGLNQEKLKHILN